MIKCPNCGQEIVEGVKFCEHCGFNLKEDDTIRLCPSCGHSNRKDNKFCLRCGTQLKNISCPYCNSKLDDGVLKCKYCGEWVNQENNKNVYQNTTSIQGNTKLFTIVSYFLTLINCLITLVMLSTPYIMLSGVLLVNLICTLLCFAVAIYLLTKYSSVYVKFLFGGTIKKHMGVIIFLNIILLMPQIFALFWNPFY